MAAVPDAERLASVKGAALSEIDAAVRTLRDPATIRATARRSRRTWPAGRSRTSPSTARKLDAVAERIAALTRARFPDLGRSRTTAAGAISRPAASTAAGRARCEAGGRTQVAIARSRIDLTLVMCCSTPAPARLALPRGRERPGLRPSEGPVWRVSGLPGRALRPDAGDPCEPVDAATLFALDAGRRSAEASRCARQPAGRPRRPRRADAPLGDAARPAADLHGHRPAWPSVRRADHHPHRAAPAPPPSAAGAAAPPRRRRAHPRGADRCLQRHLPSGQVFFTACRSAMSGRIPGGEGARAGWVPFHKLSQWLALLLPRTFEWAGVKVEG